MISSQQQLKARKQINNGWRGPGWPPAKLACRRPREHYRDSFGVEQVNQLQLEDGFAISVALLRLSA
jgi:hypothetical protein